MSLDNVVKDLGYASYTAYLNSAHWDDFRNRYAASGLPKHCVACKYPKYILHHLHYKTLGFETFADVIPVCSRCHRELGRTRDKFRLPNNRPDVIFRKIFNWNRKETVSRFEPFYKLWRETAKKVGENPSLPLKFKKHVKDLSRGNFYKISKHMLQVVRYLKDGYTTKQVAVMYEVSESYLLEYMKRYPEYFE